MADSVLLDSERKIVERNYMTKYVEVSEDYLKELYQLAQSFEFTVEKFNIKKVNGGDLITLATLFGSLDAIPKMIEMSHRINKMKEISNA